MSRRPSVLARLKLRLAGLPRSPGELDAGLRLLAAHRRLGWFASGHHGARTRGGEPLPWWTYSAILWLDGHLRAGGAGGRCLELGAGSSTSWLARRFDRVVSLEHDPGWYQRLLRRVPANVDLRLVESTGPGAYLAALDEGAAWDLVVIDGPQRMTCLPAAAERVSRGGLVLLDDSDRPEYGESIRALHRLGLARTDFFGVSPGVAHLRCTSVFGHPGLRSASEAPAYFGHGIASYRDL